jgi:hypothetical protein
MKKQLFNWNEEIKLEGNNVKWGGKQVHANKKSFFTWKI